MVEIMSTSYLEASPGNTNRANHLAINTRSPATGKMDQDLEKRREYGCARSFRKSGDKENRSQKASPKGQAARVVLKPSSSTSKTAPRIMLRAQKTTPKGSTKIQEIPPSGKGSSGTKQAFASLRTTPDSQMNNSSPSVMMRTTVRENRPRSVYDDKAERRQQPPTATPKSNEIGQTHFNNESLVANLTLSGYSEEGSDWTLTPIPQPASLNRDAFTAPNSTDVSSGEELNFVSQVGDSPFHADGELSGDDLESRMRSFLRRRERNRISRRSEIKSVKWDPAIVACGPLTPITNKLKLRETHESRVAGDHNLEEPTKDSKSSLDSLNQIAADLKKADRRILQQLLEALKSVDSSDDTTIIRPKKARVPLAEQNMKDNHPPPPNSPARNTTTLTVKGLNPEAPIYRKFAPTTRCTPQTQSTENKENIPQGSRWPLNVQRKRPHSSEGGKDIRHNNRDPAKVNKYIPPALRTRHVLPTTEKDNMEPIWIKTSSPYSVLPSPVGNEHSGGMPITQESHVEAPLDPLYPFQPPLLAQPPRVPLDNQPILPPAWMTGFSNMQQQQFTLPINPISLYAPYTGLGFQPNIIPSPALSSDWYPLPIIPLPITPAQHEQFLKPSCQPEKITKDRTNRLPVNVIPSQTGPGRTAITLETTWATQVLEKFTARYPKTGTKKPLPKPTKEKKIATKIQQRLEVLLLYQKEKKALEEKFGHTAGLSLPRQASLELSDTSSDDSLDVATEIS